MKKLLPLLQNYLRQGTPCMLLTIIENRGSTPRRAGAAMLVLSDSAEGTIGGGAIEYQSILHAQQLLRNRSGDIRSFTLTNDDAAGLGMICGGSAKVLFHCLGQTDLAWVEAANTMANEAFYIARVTTPAIKTAVYTNGSFAAGDCFPLDTSLLQKKTGLIGDLFFEYIAPPGKVYVFGGGHVSRELVPLLAHVGFSPIVFEDRPEFADAALFPDAEQVLLGDFRYIGERVSLTADDFIVIMTRGHQCDYEILSQVLLTPARYIGCIGSQVKVKLTRERLANDGFCIRDFARIHSPIGLPIGAQTPAEIAVSIAAQLIFERASEHV